MLLRMARFEKGITQLELAMLSEINQNKISMIERGFRVPSDVEHKKLAKALGVKIKNLEFPEPSILKNRLRVR